MSDATTTITPTTPATLSAGFTALAESDLKALRALRAAQRQLRRIDLRIAIKSSRVQLARALKSKRGMHGLSDLRWHAHLTQREAQALQALVGATSARKLIAAALAKVRARLGLRPAPGGTP